MNPLRPTKYSRFNSVMTPKGNGIVVSYFFEVGTGDTVYLVKTETGELLNLKENELTDDRGND